MKLLDIAVIVALLTIANALYLRERRKTETDCGRGVWVPRGATCPLLID